MIGFEEGYEFFTQNASGIVGVEVGDSYIRTVNSEINNLVDDLNSLEGFSTASKMLKGDVAEFWHSGTFNIDAALKDSKDRAFVDRSHDFASTDISTNYGDRYGLKYYSDGQASAKAQATSYFQRFMEYKSKGGSGDFASFLKDRGITNPESVLNDPIYSGQIRIIPRDQLEEATKWLERMIKSESVRRPEQVYRYEETLALLKDRLSNNKGVESIPLSKQEAEALATLAKQGKVSAEDLGLTTENLVKYEYIMQQAFKAGISAATISVVLKVAPEIVKAIDYLIKNGYVDKEQFKKIGFSAITGGAEGFIRGSVSAALTTSCKAGLLGETLKGIEPTIIQMDMANTTKTNSTQAVTKEKVMNTIKKILLYTVGIVGGIFLLCVLYQILEFLFVGAILLIAWLGPVFPRRWR